MKVYEVGIEHVGKRGASRARALALQYLPLKLQQTGPHARTCNTVAIDSPSARSVFVLVPDSRPVWLLQELQCRSIIMSANRNAYFQGHHWFSLLYHFAYFVAYSRKNDRYTYAQMPLALIRNLNLYLYIAPEGGVWEIKNHVEEAFLWRCHI